MGKTLPRPRTTAPAPPPTVKGPGRPSARRPAAAVAPVPLTLPESAPTAFEPTGCEEIDALLARQGRITEAEYFDLPPARHVDYQDGFLEVHDVAGMRHQRIVAVLFKILETWVLTRALGEVFISPVPMKLGPRRFREPDVAFLSNGTLAGHGEDDWMPAADLVMEVVSRSDTSQRRDLVTKRAEYAGAGIAEYWIVDPEARRITVLRLDGGKYVVYSTAGIRGTAKSALLPGFTVRPADVLPGK